MDRAGYSITNDILFLATFHLNHLVGTVICAWSVTSQLTRSDLEPGCSSA